MKQQYKYSHYNLTVPMLETKETLLFSAFNGGLIVLDEDESRILERIKCGEMGDSEEEKALWESLKEKGYLVDSEIDEPKRYAEKYKARTHGVFYAEKANVVLTFGPSNACNMACPYCFEFHKDNQIMNDELIERVEPFLESIIKNSPNIKNWEQFGVTWYGGEPLLAIKQIQKLTPILKRFAERHNIKYKSEIITNGILLTRENWEILKECDCDWAQITLDGAKETHDVHRPLRNKNARNYEQILENIAAMPEGMGTTIRVNVDKDVAANFSRLLDDLEAHGIWPQRYLSVNIAPAWLRTYKEAGETDTENRFSELEWADAITGLRELKLEHFNRWAAEAGKKTGKLAFLAETPTFEDCWSVISPYSFVIDANGYTYKCWESIQNADKRVQHISEEYQVEKYRPYLDYSRLNSSPDCQVCEYLPICPKLGCTEHPTMICSKEAGDVEMMLKKQYLNYYRNPDKVGFREKK